MVIGGGYSPLRAEMMDSSHAYHQLVNTVTKSACSGEPSPITDWLVNPDNKQLAFAPSLLPFDPPTFLIERQSNTTYSATAATTAKNNRCFVLRPTTCWSCSCRWPWWTAIVKRNDQQPFQPSRRNSYWGCHPKSAIREQAEATVILGAGVRHDRCARGVGVNRSPRVDPVAKWSASLDQVVPVPPAPDTRSPVAMVPTADSQTTPSPITSGPHTTGPAIATPTTPVPETSPTITITFSVDELVGLMSSHLPPVPFSPTSSPPEFRAVQWMTETDKNTEGLSDDCLVRRCAMASNGFIILGLNNWTYF